MAAGSPACLGSGERRDPQQRSPAVLPSPEQPRLWGGPRAPGAGTGGSPVAFKGLCGPGLEPRQQPDVFQETQDPENRSPAMIAKLKEGEMGQWGALGSRATRAEGITVTPAGTCAPGTTGGHCLPTGMVSRETTAKGF